MQSHTIKILVVDDNEDDVIMLQEAFATEPLVSIIQVVSDGVQAMDFLNKKGNFADAARPDMILLDINMPKMNGYEVLDEIRNHTDLKQIPVIMLSTSDRQEDISKSYAHGACSFISKPVEHQALVSIAQQFSRYWAMVSKLPSHA